jgi:Phosphotransferase enzyme family
VIRFPELNRVLGVDLVSLVGTIDATLIEVMPLSGVGYPGYQPSAFRLRFADGRLLKGRRFGSTSQAATVEYVLQCLGHPGFPRVLARSGSALLTEWIAGQPLHLVDCTAQLLRQSGTLHGFMHTVPVPKESPYRPCTTLQPWHTALECNLAELAKAGVLERDEAVRAFELAMRFVPGNYAVGFIHSDFCAENLVRRPSGEVWVVDDETLKLDPYDYDLARTWYRWPMSPLQREAYLDGYHRYRSSKDFLTHFPYWGIAALANSAVFRLRKQKDATSVPLRRLRGLLRDLKRGISPEEAVFRS